MEFYQSNLTLVKLLIEKKLFIDAYNLKNEFIKTNNVIYYYLSNLNFGKVLSEIDNIFYENIDYGLVDNYISNEEKFNYINSSNYNDIEPNYEKDYFDAMTDGHYGDYSDFIENGGNIDEIDD